VTKHTHSVGIQEENDQLENDKKEEEGDNKEDSEEDSDEGYDESEEEFDDQEVFEIGLTENEFAGVPLDSNWILIGEFLDCDSIKPLWNVPGFVMIACFLQAKKSSEFIHDSIKHYEPSEDSSIPYNSLRLSDDDSSEMWFEWGADKCGFHSPARFEFFCHLARVVPTTYVAIPTSYETRNPYLYYNWISEDKKVTFSCSSNPLHNEEGYVHYFGCTGVRSGPSISWIGSRTKKIVFGKGFDGTAEISSGYSSCSF